MVAATQHTANAAQFQGVIIADYGSRKKASFDQQLAGYMNRAWMRELVVMVIVIATLLI